MASPTPDLAEENKVLREKNTELVMKVQHWKMLAAQRENEKLDLMKELNEMRLKLARLRSNGNVQASKLDTALQSASEKALAHLVRASGEIARTIDLAKTYMRERKEVEAVSPRWSAIGGTPKTEKVHRVPPMMIGGQFIQPVVSLSRTLLNTSNPRPTARSPNQNRNVTERAVPMHVMLQDVYIPLTRIDAGEPQATNMETEAEANSEDSAEGSELDTSGDHSEIETSQQISDEEFNTSRRLDAVAEDMEPEVEVQTPIRNSRGENPLEGPSWLLDAPSNTSKSVLQSRRNLEPDSTTEVEDITTPVRNEGTEIMSTVRDSPGVSCEFSPTVRRRKRTSSPHASAPAPASASASAPAGTPRRMSHYSPRPAHKRNSSNGRVLKVMVAKMRLESASPPASPASPAPACKRAARGAPASPLPPLAAECLDAPSPNGATMPGVIVSEAPRSEVDAGASGEPAGRRRHAAPGPDARSEGEAAPERDSRGSRPRRQDISSRYGSHDSRDSDSGSGSDLHSEGRTRRTRNKVVSYQEKPLNRKMRR